MGSLLEAGVALEEHHITNRHQSQAVQNHLCHCASLWLRVLNTNKGHGKQNQLLSYFVLSNHAQHQETRSCDQ